MVTKTIKTLFFMVCALLLTLLLCKARNDRQQEAKQERFQAGMRIDALMRKAFKAVYEKAKQYNVTLRVAAYMVALGSLEEAMKIRGMI